MDYSSICVFCVRNLCECDLAVPLECGHRICMNCAVHMAAVSRARYTVAGQKCKKVTVKCAACKMRSKLDDGKVEEVLDRGERPDCGDCEMDGHACSAADCGERATVRCERCGLLCAGCADRVHSIFPDHKCVAIEESSKNTREVCEKHCDECVLYCTKCAKNVCLMCADSEHAGHGTVWLDGSELARDCAACRDSIAEMRAALAAEEEEGDVLEQSLREVAAVFEEAREMLRRKEEAAVAAVRKIVAESAERRAEVAEALGRAGRRATTCWGCWGRQSSRRTWSGWQRTCGAGRSLQRA